MEQQQDWVKLGLSILLFPVYFQGPFLEFAWATGDPLWILVAKRALILLPTLAVIFACWATVACLATVLVRQDRRKFVTSLFVTWWDLARMIFGFWGGLIKFGWLCCGWVVGFLRMAAFATWVTILDIVFAPMTWAKAAGETYSRPGVPWLAFVMTVTWSLLEAAIFTFVMTPLVIDVLSGVSGRELNPTLVQGLLYFVMLACVMGSYAVLSTWGDAVKERNVPKIVQIGVMEFLVMGFEVVFLYREFVDALVPWFMQQSGGQVRLGVVAILGIATFAWLGIRSMTWFLFANTGTPMLMTMIQRRGGLRNGDGTTGMRSQPVFTRVTAGVDHIKSDIDWVHARGDELLGAFLLPPLQIVAAAVNFCTLLISGTHLFQLPFKSLKDVLNSKQLIEKVKIDKAA